MPVPAKLIIEYAQARRGARDQWPHDPGPAALAELPLTLRRARPPELPEVGELEAVRHFTRLSQLNFSIDTHFYPLGSCTMKYNPKICEQVAGFTGFKALHPLQPATTVQGFLQVYYELERALSEICGMAEFSLQPSAGAHGELAGLL